MLTRTWRPLIVALFLFLALALAAGTAAADEEGGGGGEDPSCPPEETCVEPEPCPPEEVCGDVDSDSDGFYDADEIAFGSDPLDAASTPEHAFLPETCADTLDNDGDGATDMDDAGCTLDSDEDGTPDVQDNCPYDHNPDQADSDGDGVGDLCDFDADNDGFEDKLEELLGSDPFDAASTPEHSWFPETCDDTLDNDGDGVVDADDPGCAPDADGDFVPDDTDNCPDVYNPDQTDSDNDGVGDACVDSDGDGFYDADETAFGSDPNDAASTPEHGTFFETCEDGIDNDGDSLIDGEDPGCDAGVAEAAPRGSEGGGDDDVVYTVFASVDDGGGSPDVLEASDSPETSPASLPTAGAQFAGSGNGPNLLALGLISVGGLLAVSGAFLALRRGRVSGRAN
ncbi:MAG: thrombospondin type 3 repeat-containing protein [Chloroflexi bacterium]|nr:thrombospondin type 3 repeat-containing protein [Chloroflexota bacterium]